jgi:hypothetical protein
MTLRSGFWIILAASGLTFAQTRPANVPKTGYAPVNGLKMYYEVQGITHYNIFSSMALASTVTPFLDAPK